MTSLVGPIRLLVMDLDGTLLPPDRPISPRTVAAVRAAIGQGVVATIATGRMATSVVEYALELGIRAPLIALQGAAIHLPPAAGSRRPGRLLAHRPLAADAAREAIAWCCARGLRPHLNHLDEMVMSADDPWADDYSGRFGGRFRVVPDLEAWTRRPVSKVIAVGPAGLPASLVDEARAHFAGRAHPTVSHPEFLEFVAPDVSKGRALRWLARRERIPLAAAMAIGDQLNDLEMVQAAGAGVAMAGSPDELQAAAWLVAPPVEQDGAARVIEDWVLAGRPGSGEARPAESRPVATPPRRTVAAG